MLRKETNKLVAVVIMLCMILTLFGNFPVASAANTDLLKKAYITSFNTGKVDVVDLENGTVELGKITVGTNPNSAGFNPNGTQVFVTNRSSNTVSVIDPTTDTVVSTIAVGQQPHGVAFNTDGSKAYVANLSGSTLSVINTATLTVTGSITGLSWPTAMAVIGQKLYVTQSGTNNKVAIVDMANDTVTSEITVGNGPYGLSVNAAGTKIYLANSASNTVSVINVADNTIDATIPVGSSPHATEVSPDGSRVYVANASSSNVSVINTTNNTVVSTITVGSAPYVIGMSADGTRVFTVNYSSSNMSVIRTSDNTVVQTIPLSNGPFMVGTFMVSTAVAAAQQQVAAPTASPVSGEVASGTTIALSSTTTGATIYYTTDGTAPTASSTLYGAPIILTTATTIKAIAVKSGMTDSAVMSQSYTVPVNTPPTVSSIVYQSIKVNESLGPIPFTVSDGETSAGSLTVTAATYNSTLIPLANISLGGNGGNRTVTLTPATDQTGTTEVWLTVTDANGATASTGFQVTVQASSNADLSALTASSGPLNTAFVSSTTAYSTTVSNSTYSTTVTGTVYDPNATVRVNGVVTASAAASVAIPLNVGANPILIEVTAQDGTTKKTYTITVNRLPSSNADLSALSVSTGPLNTAFVTSTTSYSTTVPNNTTSTTVTGTVYDPNATVRVNGVVTASAAASVAIPLNVGANTITVEVTAQDSTTKKAYTITVNRLDDQPNADDSVTPTQPSVRIVVDGVVQEQLATAKYDKIGDQTATIITVDNEKVIAKLEKESNKVLTIPVTGDSDIVVGVLNGKLVKAMEGKDATIEIKTDRGTYTLPALQINIDSISAQLGSNVKLEDINISIKIALSVPTTAATIQTAATDGKITLVGAPITFEVTATLGGKTVDINQFNSYVERQIVLPAGTSSAQVTTGVVLNADGTLTHVPTNIETIDGKMTATINSLTNSSYAVVLSPKTFADVETHWSKQDVNDMASRQVVQGVTDQTFQPDKAITRAEFLAIMVRALGLKSGMGTETPKDVQASDWFAGVVQTGVSYNLIRGYEDGTFRPNQTITRNEAAAFVARALTIAKLNNGLTSEEVTMQLEFFKDGSTIPAWAKNDIAVAVKNNILQGADGKLSSDDNVTRAQGAAMLRRLLQQANLINK